MSTQIMVLIALLGEKNDKHGNLTSIATSRCEEAIRILEGEPSYKVIPTGAFGKNFNTSDTAHGLLLRDYLLGRGISRERILPPTNSSNTHEDALCVNKAATDLSCKKVIVVTSDYHMVRTKYIFRRVMSDIELEFSPATTNLASDEMREKDDEEEEKLRKLKKNWINVPRYSKGRSFPREIYEAANQEQKHYDKISLAIVTGIIFVGAYPVFFQIQTQSFGGKGIVFLVAAIIIFFLLMMYVRAARTARTARQVMKLVEIAFDESGFSSTYYGQSFIENTPSMMKIVVILSCTAMFLSLFSSLFLISPMALVAVSVIVLVILALLYRRNRMKNVLDHAGDIWRSLVN